MIEVVQYNSDKLVEWNNFVTQAKNGCFLFDRNFMDYHAQRFNDYSLMLFCDGKLSSIFPLHKISIGTSSEVVSHNGLTFGGMLIVDKTSTLSAINYLNAFNQFLSINGVSSVVYKASPQIYKSNFAYEDEYFMFRLGAEKISCNLSSCIDLSLFRSDSNNISRNRRRNIKISEQHNIRINTSNCWEAFWDIMTLNLQQNHNTRPVHTISEIRLLKQRFPKQIELIDAQYNGKVVGGAVLFKFQKVLKVQYLHASPLGKELRAVDALYAYIFREYRNLFKYVDFGTSNLNNGNFINEGLLHQKEGYGARSIIFNTYRYNTNNIITN